MGRILRRVRQPGVYFVTTDTWQRRPIFLKPDVARIVVEQLLACREKGFYKLHAFVLMPEHLHVLLTPGEETTLEKAMQIIKGGSAYRIKKELLYQGPVWHVGYYDRWIRDRDEYASKKSYVERNPTAALLCDRGEDYPFVSSNGKFVLDASKFN